MFGNRNSKRDLSRKCSIHANSSAHSSKSAFFLQERVVNALMTLLKHGYIRLCFDSNFDSIRHFDSTHGGSNSMKFTKSSFFAALAALALITPACGGGAKKDDAKADHKKDDKKDTKKDVKKEEPNMPSDANPAVPGGDAKPAEPGDEVIPGAPGGDHANPGKPDEDHPSKDGH